MGVPTIDKIVHVVILQESFFMIESYSTLMMMMKNYNLCGLHYIAS